MKKIMPGLVVALALMSSAAMAQERAGDAALGAVSGALVLGPIGAVAGAFVGYTAGPSIANAWGVRHSSYPRHVRRASTAEPGPNATENVPTPRSRADVPALASRAEMPAAASTPAPAAVSPPPTSASVAPPVQPLE